MYCIGYRPGWFLPCGCHCWRNHFFHDLCNRWKPLRSTRLHHSVCLAKEKRSFSSHFSSFSPLSFLLTSLSPFFSFFLSSLFLSSLFLSSLFLSSLFLSSLFPSSLFPHILVIGSPRVVGESLCGKKLHCYATSAFSIFLSLSLSLSSPLFLLSSLS